MQHNKIRGNEIEEYAALLFIKNGLTFTKVDSVHDFEVEGRKVEVKSCALAIWNGIRHRPGDDKDDEHPHLRMGRFQFDQDTVGLYHSNAELLFFVSHEGQCIVLGAADAKSFWDSEDDARKTRFVSLTSPRFRHLMRFEEWVKKMKGEG